MLDPLLTEHVPVKGLVFTNGLVSLTKDLVFGLSVLTEDGWVAWAWLDEADRDLVRRLLDHSPTCPDEWKTTIYTRTPEAS